MRSQDSVPNRAQELHSYYLPLLAGPFPAPGALVVSEAKTILFSSVSLMYMCMTLPTHHVRKKNSLSPVVMFGAESKMGESGDKATVRTYRVDLTSTVNLYTQLQGVF